MCRYCSCARVHACRPVRLLPPCRTGATVLHRLLVRAHRDHVVLRCPVDWARLWDALIRTVRRSLAPTFLPHSRRSSFPYTTQISMCTREMVIGDPEALPLASPLHHLVRWLRVEALHVVADRPVVFPLCMRWRLDRLPLDYLGLARSFGRHWKRYVWSCECGHKNFPVGSPYVHMERRAEVSRPQCLARPGAVLCWASLSQS